MRKKIIGLVAVALMISCGSLVIAESGPGTAHVTNAAPTVTTQILNETWDVKTSLMPNVQYYYNVTVFDTDGTGDLGTVTVDMAYKTTTYADDPAQTYRFRYSNTTGVWSKIRPSSGTGQYLNIGQSSLYYIDNVTVTVSFAITLNKTAKDTNTVADWRFAAITTDQDSITSVEVVKNIIMGPYVGLTYVATTGTAFEWTGAPDSNQTAAFTTTVTSNDVYTLDASYTGWFQSPWGDPELWVKQDGQSNYVQLVNASAVPGDNITWFTSLTTGGYLMVQTHKMGLVFPPGVEKEVDYVGIVIWINARNS